MNDYNELYYNEFTVSSRTAEVYGPENLAVLLSEVKQFAQLNFDYDILNYTGQRICIGTSDGIVYWIDPLGYTRNIQPGIYIVRRTRADKNSVEWSMQNDKGDLGNPDAAEVLRQYATGTDYQKAPGGDLNYRLRNMNVRSEVLYQITISDLRSYGAVFVRNLNLVVGTSKSSLRHPKWRHPNSQQGQMTAGEIRMTYGENYEDSLGFKIQIVNNSKARVPNYVNLGGFVSVVPIISDMHRNDGIYIVRNNCATNNFSVYDEDFEAEFYTFGDPNCPIKFWFTMKDAETLGNAEAILKENLEKAKHERAMEQLKQKEQTDWMKYAQTIVPIMLATVSGIFAYLNKSK